MTVDDPVGSNNRQKRRTNQKKEPQKLEATVEIRGSLNLTQPEESDRTTQRDQAGNTGKQPFLQRWSVVANVAVGIALICVGYLQFRVYTQQAAIMRSQQRPWLKGEFKLISLSKGANGIDSTINVTWKNVGNYPAEIVFVGGRVIPTVDPLSLTVKQEEMCKQERDAWPNIIKNPGNSIFPNETSPVQTQNNLLPETEVESSENARLKPFITLAYVGCITYGSHFQGDVHQTGFLLDFADGDLGSAVPKPVFFKLGETGNWDISSVSLQQAAFGGFAN